MKKVLLLSLFIACGLISYAQTFQKVYGDSIQDGGLFFLPTLNNGFYLLANSKHHGAPFALNVIEVNQIGDSLGTTQLSSNFNGGDVCRNCMDGFVTINNVVQSGVNNQYFDTITVNSYDTLGNLLSTWSYADTFALVSPKIFQTNDGGFIITSGIWNFQFEAFVFFMKIDANGNVLWRTQALPYSLSEEHPIDLIETSDHSYIAEIIQASGSNWAGQKVLMKLDTNGNIIWTSQLSWGYVGWLNQQVVIANGGYVYVDNTSHNISTSGYSRICMVDSNGIFQWANSYYDVNTKYSNVIVKNSGGYYLCGSRMSTTGNSREIIITTVNQNADSISSISFGLDSVSLFPYYFKELSDGRIAIIGTYSPYLNNNISRQDIYFAVTDTLGNVTYVTENSDLQEELKIYPNPSTGSFTLQALHSTFKRIEVFNLLGECVFVKSLTQGEVDLQFALSKGFYLLKASDGRSFVTKKLVVE